MNLELALLKVHIKQARPPLHLSNTFKFSLETRPTALFTIGRHKVCLVAAEAQAEAITCP
jgi:hypothetical protein